MAPHDSASFFPSSVLTSRLKTQQNSRGQAGCATGTHTHVGPPEPPLPLQGQVRLVPHQHHGHAAGTGRIRAQTTLGPPPREGQHLPCLPPALVQLLVEGLDHLEAVGTRGHPGTAFPLRVPPVPGDPSLNLGGSSPPQGCHRVDQDIAVDADDEGAGQDGVLVLGGGGKTSGRGGWEASSPSTPPDPPNCPSITCPAVSTSCSWNSSLPTTTILL